MTRHVLPRKYSLNTLHPTAESAVRSIQEEIMQDDQGGQLQASYSFLFMAQLSEVQRAQIIKFLEATPLVSLSRSCFVLSDRRPWQFWLPKLTQANLCLSWREKDGAFVTSPVVPQP